MGTPRSSNFSFLKIWDQNLWFNQLLFVLHRLSFAATETAGTNIRTEWSQEKSVKSEKNYRMFSKLNRIIYPDCPQVHHLTVVVSDEKKHKRYFSFAISKGHVKNEDSLFRFRFRHSSLILFLFSHLAAFGPRPICRLSQLGSLFFSSFFFPAYIRRLIGPSPSPLLILRKFSLTDFV